jgi:acetyl-CoA carboxylase carboxyl transferase subunit beta
MKGLSKLFTQSKLFLAEKAHNRQGFEGWLKCHTCHEMLYKKEVEDNLDCCPKCSFHFPMSAQKRIELLADPGSFKELFTELEPNDPLQFVDTEPYQCRLARAQEKLKRKEGFYAGTCLLFQRQIALGVMDFGFMGGSMGSVVGEKIARLVEHAIVERLPVVIVCASGGARMQESCLSLMQMAKTAAAFTKLEAVRLPYLSICTHPTTGGVTASFATLADVILAEPQALIAFAGPRVVEQTIGQKLPPESQKSEFLLKKGMVDLICERKVLKEKVAFFIEMFSQKNEIGSHKVKDQKSLSSATIDSLLQVKDTCTVTNYN